MIAYVVVSAVMFIFAGLMIYERDIARKKPINYIILVIFTLCQTYFVAMICQPACVGYYCNDYSLEYLSMSAVGGMIMGFLASLTVYVW